MHAHIYFYAHGVQEKRDEGRRTAGDGERDVDLDGEAVVVSPDEDLFVEACPCEICCALGPSTLDHRLWEDTVAVDLSTWSHGYVPLAADCAAGDTLNNSHRYNARGLWALSVEDFLTITLA